MAPVAPILCVLSPLKLQHLLGAALIEMPSDPVTMFTIHQLRGPSVAPDNNSVFAMREPHFMLEIMGCVTREESRHTFIFLFSFSDAIGDMQSSLHNNMQGAVWNAAGVGV